MPQEGRSNMGLLLDLPSGNNRDKTEGEVRHDNKMQPRALNYLDGYFVVTAVNGSDESNVFDEFSITIGQ